MARSNSKKTSGVRLSDFLAEKAAAPRPIYVLRGTDPYLLDQARRHVRAQTIGDTDPGLAVVETLGAEAVLADVMDSLRTLPFLAPRRLVIVREAEDFLEKPARKAEKVRDFLRDYLDNPSATGSLCLEVSSWNESTNLAKRVAQVGVLVACELTDPARLPAWLQGEATKRYRKKLSYGAAQMLVDHLGTDFASLLSASTPWRCTRAPTRRSTPPTSMRSSPAAATNASGRSATPSPSARSHGRWNSSTSSGPRAWSPRRSSASSGRPSGNSSASRPSHAR